MSKKCYAFAYSAWNTHAQMVHGFIYAEHIMIAKNNLTAQGFLIKKIHKTFFSPRLNFKAKDLLLMTQQLAILIQAALPVIFCLKTLSSAFPPIMRMILNQIIQTIEQGKNLSAALAMHPHIFPHYFIYLIQVGEESGKLAQILEQLSTYQEKILTRAKELKKAFTYPLLVLVISLIITLALLLVIVPQFQLLFANVKSQLPLMTQMVFGLSDVLQQINIMYALVFIFISTGFIYMAKHNATLIRLTQDLLYYLPMIGRIIHDNQQTRYLRSLSVALQAGLPLTQALQLSAQVMQYTRLARNITLISNGIQSGMSLKQTLSQTAQFSQIVIQLVAMSEQTGQLPSLLAQSAHILEQGIDQKMQQVTSMLQPILVVLLGAILGCLIIALYLPVFKLGTLY